MSNSVSRNRKLHSRNHTALRGHDSTRHSMKSKFVYYCSKCKTDGKPGKWITEPLDKHTARTHA